MVLQSVVESVQDRPLRFLVSSTVTSCQNNQSQWNTPPDIWKQKNFYTGDIVGFKAVPARVSKMTMLSRMFSVENKTFKIHCQHVCNILQFAYLLVLDLGIKSGALSMLKNYSQLNCVPKLRMLPSFHWMEHLQMAPVLKINMRSLKKWDLKVGTLVPTGGKYKKAAFICSLPLLNQPALRGFLG